MPIFIWNAIFYRKLPAAYQKEDWDKIPKPLDIAETILRIFLFAVPVLLTFNRGDRPQVKTDVIGWSLYLGGMFIYFLSWLFEISWPHTPWSKSRAGFMAPTYTSAIWLVGVFLLIEDDVLHTRFLRPAYLAIIVAFESVHTLHAYLVFQRSD